MSSIDDTKVEIAISLAKQDAKLFSIACRACGVHLHDYAMVRVLAAANLLNYKAGQATLREAAKIEAAFPQGWSRIPKDEEE